MNKQQLASKIWESANRMRSKIEANEYKDYILGFIFYKFLSEKEVRMLRGQDATEADIRSLSEDDSATVEYLQNELGYFIAYENLFSTWIDKGKDFDVSDVRDGLSAFNRLISSNQKKKRVFEKVFNTLETGLSKLGDTSGSQTKAISELIHLIRDIPMDGREDYDVLGFIYEYLIGQFAANAGKKAGEFYTPHEVSLLMSEIVAHHLRGKERIRIYDPTSGSGSLLINIGQAVARHTGNADGIMYYAQELKENTYNLTRMNLVMRGIEADNIEVRNADTLEDDWPLDPQDHFKQLTVDAVVSNPPYSQRWDPADKENDPRYRYGLAPSSKADYAFLLHDLYHLNADGIMTIVLPHGVLFRGDKEEEIRRNLVEHRNIDAVIGLPANIFFGTGIPTIIMVLRQKRERDDVLVVDASRHFEKAGKSNRLRASDIKRIADVVAERADVAGFSRVVSIDEIRENDYNLNIPRYVDSGDSGETWDIYASMFGGIPKSEIDVLSDYWDALPGLKDALFDDDGTPYLHLKAEDVGAAVASSAAARELRERFEDAFAGFGAQLEKTLVDGVEQVVLAQGEVAIGDEIRRRVADVPLVDFYDAYQVLDECWREVAADIEVLQTEGRGAARLVDPNMVVKRKKGKDVEVQEGWTGHVFPFDLVQRQMFSDRLQALRDKESRLAAISAKRDEIIEEVPEEDKGSDVFNDAGDAFVASEVKKARKGIDLASATEFERTVVCVADLLDEEAALKKEMKRESADLHQLTKEAIESLTDGQVRDLLCQKWISPLCGRLSTLPDNALDVLISRVSAVADKYSTTFSQVESDIRDAEQELLAMLDGLAGNEFDMRGLAEFKTLLGGE